MRPIKSNRKGLRLRGRFRPRQRSRAEDGRHGKGDRRAAVFAPPLDYSSSPFYSPAGATAAPPQEPHSGEGLLQLLLRRQTRGLGSRIERLAALALNGLLASERPAGRAARRSPNSLPEDDPYRPLIGLSRPAGQPVKPAGCFIALASENPSRTRLERTQEVQEILLLPGAERVVEPMDHTVCL